MSNRPKKQIIITKRIIEINRLQIQDDFESLFNGIGKVFAQRIIQFRKIPVELFKRAT